MKIFWIQMTEGGIPGDPEFFSHRTAMLNRWAQIWTEAEDDPVDLLDEVVTEERVYEVDYFSINEGDVEWRCGEGELHDLI